jgi:hypothetical protein
MHNAVYRVAYGQKGAEGGKREMLPLIAFTSFKSRFEQPKIEEGASLSLFVLVMFSLSSLVLSLSRSSAPSSPVSDPLLFPQQASTN